MICNNPEEMEILELIHTLLFMLRENRLQDDLYIIEKCMKSLEKSTYKTVVVYNQGFWDNAKLIEYLKSYRLECIVIGEGVNVGIVRGRQQCFEYVWKEFPEASFVTELHTDMAFTYNWEDPLVDYLKNHEEEPLMCSGILMSNGRMLFGDAAQTTLPPDDLDEMDDYLAAMKRNEVIFGFTHPCVHRMSVLKELGGYDTRFMTGMEGFEDDSLLVGYYYYYGTCAHWQPKIHLDSIVLHRIAGQRAATFEAMTPNLEGLYRQHGRMGFKVLSQIHRQPGSIDFFTQQYDDM